MHKCGRRNVLALQPKLADVCIRTLSLSVEANTTSLGRSPLFEEWCSLDQNDRLFGSLGSFWEIDLSGRNMLFVCDFALTKAELDKVYSRARTFVKSEQPTRLLIIGPTPDSKTVANRGCLEVAKIRRGFPLIHSISGQSDTFLADQSVSMFLVLNRES